MLPVVGLWGFLALNFEPNCRICLFATEFPCLPSDKADKAVLSLDTMGRLHQQNLSRHLTNQGLTLNAT